MSSFIFLGNFLLSCKLYTIIQYEKIAVNFLRELFPQRIVSQKIEAVYEKQKDEIFFFQCPRYLKYNLWFLFYRDNILHVIVIGRVGFGRKIILVKGDGIMTNNDSYIQNMNMKTHSFLLS